MGNATFDSALMNMASYIGNYILPISAGLVLCIGLYRYAHSPRIGERYVTAGLACLLVSALVRLAEHFSTQNSGQDQFFYALLSLTNWTANVIIPLYAAVALFRAILAYAGFPQSVNHGGNVGRNILVCFGCLGVSMTLRLLEFFITSGAGGLH